MVLLHEEDIKYPPTNTLPKATGPWVLCKLVQYPMKDGDGNIVADEYRQPVFSSLFANAVMFLGKVTARTTWMTGQQTQADTGRKIYSLSLGIYTDEEIRQAIHDSNVFIYLNREDEDAPPLLIAEFKQLMADSKKAEVNEPTEDTPIQNIQEPTSQGQQVMSG